MSKRFADTCELLEHYKVPCAGGVGAGWHPLLESLISDLRAMGWDGNLHQVKEKFGGLRFYVGGATPEQYARIDEAEEQSLRVCEACGAPGERRYGGWIRTLCEGCYK